MRDEIYRRLSHVRKEQLLSRLAARAFLSSELFIPTGKLVRFVEEYLAQLPADDKPNEIDGETVIRAIEAQHGLLVNRAVGLYSFSHLTFQEYFTARYLVENMHDGTLAKVIEDHAGDDQWREVFLLIASLLDNAEGFLISFVKAISQSITEAPGGTQLFEKLDEEEEKPISVFSNDYVVASASPLVRPARRGSAFMRGTNESDYDLGEALFTLAGQLHFVRTGDRALRRARILHAMLLGGANAATDFREGSAKNPKTLTRYLRAAATFAECLQLAAVSNRERFANVILARSTFDSSRRSE